jgi:hypothetical protein
MDEHLLNRSSRWNEDRAGTGRFLHGRAHVRSQRGGGAFMAGSALVPGLPKRRGD